MAKTIFSKASAATLAFALPMLGLTAAPIPGLAQGGSDTVSGVFRETPDQSASGGETAPSDETPVLNRIANVGEAVPDPVAEAKREIGASCLKVDYPKDFVRWSDLNGDGIDDAFISFNVVCDGYRGAFCGSSDCPGRVFVSDGEGVFRRTSLPLNAKPAGQHQGLPAVAVTLSGFDCGRRSGSCRVMRVWDGADFIAPELLTADGRQRAAERIAASRDREAELARARERASREQDYLTTAALFRAEGEPDPLWLSQVEELEASGALQAEPAFRSYSPGDEWSYEPLGRGRARAWMESVYGYASLQIACRAGDETIALAFSGEEGIFAPRAGRDAQAVLAEITVSGRVRGTVTLQYVAAQDFWVTRIPAQGEIAVWLRRGSRAAVWEAGSARRYGDPAGRFALSGSRRAIEATLRACGRTPSDEVLDADPAGFDSNAEGDAFGGGDQRYDDRPQSGWGRWRRRYDIYDEDTYRGRQRVPLRRSWD